MSGATTEETVRAAADPEARATFQLFAGEDRCLGTLPTNGSPDEFRLFRFIQLRDQLSKRPFVIPIDFVAPQLLSFYRSRFPAAPLDDLRGGRPLVAEWEDVIQPPADETADVLEIEVRNVDALLARRQVRTGKQSYDLDLTAGAVRELLARGITTVIGREGDRQVPLRLRTPVRPEGAARTFDITDLNAFLAQPSLVVGGVSFTPKLTAANIQDLRSTGRTQVGGAGAAAVYLQVVDATSELRPAGPPEVDAGGEGGGVLPPPSRGFDLVVYMPYRQRWDLLGYSRGEIVNSFSLGPQEQLTIEVFTWDRLKTLRETSATSESERTNEAAFTDKDSLETLKGTTTTSGFKNDVGVSFKIPDIGFGFNVGQQVTNDVKNVNQSTHQTMTEAVTKSSSRIKSTRQTRVEESEEWGSEQRITRKLTNPNMCHTLNLDYFQVLAGYSVGSSLIRDQIRLCVLTPNLVSGQVNRSFVLAHEDVLRSVLRDPVFLPGFAAAHMLAAYDEVCSLKCMRAGCPCGAATAPSSGTGAAVAPTAIGAIVTAVNTILGATPVALCRLLPPKDKGERSPTWKAASASFAVWRYRISLEWWGNEASATWGAVVQFASQPSPTADGLRALLQSIDVNRLKPPYSALISTVDPSGKPVFWFDMLGKVARLRSAGAPPAKAEAPTPPPTIVLVPPTPTASQQTGTGGA